MATNTPYALQVGTFHLHIFQDVENNPSIDALDSLFPDHAAEARALLNAPSFVSSSNILLIDVADQRILVDSGLGNLNPADPGNLITALSANHIAPEEITMVLITHMHGDHIGGLLTNTGQAQFPKARLVLAKMEYAHWMHEDVKATLHPSQVARMLQTFAAYPPPTLVAPEEEIAPGVKVIDAAGHTPGQLAVLVESGPDRLLHVVDCWHNALQMKLPDGRVSFDTDGAQAIRTRKAMMALAERENLLVMAYHLPFPGLDRVKRNGDGFIWQTHP
jgi:glyoxylase-like metal-dependent hydrolase (beta-lactamase superfamily II)